MIFLHEQHCNHAIQCKCQIWAMLLQQSRFLRGLSDLNHSQQQKILQAHQWIYLEKCLPTDHIPENSIPARRHGSHTQAFDLVYNAQRTFPPIDVAGQHVNLPERAHLPSRRLEPVGVSSDSCRHKSQPLSFRQAQLCIQEAKPSSQTSCLKHTKSGRV